MSINLCMAVINANDVSIFSIEVANGKKVICLKSDKVGNILVPVNIDNGLSEFKLIPVANYLKAKTQASKYAGEKFVNGDKNLYNAYSTKLNSLMTQKIAWCLAILNKPGAWVNYNKLENQQPYEVFDDNDDFFDIATFDAKEGPFILRINNKEEFKSNEFDEFVKKQLRALWQKARDQEQSK